MARKKRGPQPQAQGHREDRSALLASLPLPAEIDPELLDLALTHRSYSYENGEIPHNERLEFLGDSVLGLAATEHLFATYPDTAEGTLARRRSAVVSMRALAHLASLHDLGAYIRLGRGEDLSGGRERQSILADTVEAVIGAVHLSLGFEQSRQFVLELLKPIMDNDEFLRAEYDYKTRLQEIAAEHQLLPRYEIEDLSADGVSRFCAIATVPGHVSGRGEGSSKKDAEREAAQHAVLAYYQLNGITFSVFED